MRATLFDISTNDVALTGNDWYTPRSLFRTCALFFDMDVCAPIAPEFRTCPARRYLTAADDGLTTPWHGLVWMNPPYGEPSAWVERFAAHGNGLAILQMPKRARWQARLFSAADAIAVINLTFTRPDGSEADVPWPIVMAAIGSPSVSALARAAAADRYAGGTYLVPSGGGHRSATQPPPQPPQPETPQSAAATEPSPEP